ncbi:helix-turn-helix domain-containing protein [Streptococcus suis]|uniref:helix-turn-helix domain-containing protein n=1 Tax=Streptococcus suis TaxID=1307 RepID=UPI000A83B293
MRGTKSKEKFSQELEMSRSNYSRIESGKSDPTIKTLDGTSRQMHKWGNLLCGIPLHFQQDDFQGTPVHRD